VLNQILWEILDWVALKWNGVSKPSSEDWIGVYSPSNVNFQETSPVKFQYANFSSNYIATGSGSIQFRLVNMHADYIFAFMRNGTSYPILSGFSNVVTFQNVDQPNQGHLSLTGDPTEMRLSWASGYQTSVQSVEWGTSSGVYTNSQVASNWTYTSSELCGNPAQSFGWRAPGFLNTAIMTGLVPGQQYYFSFGSDTTGWSLESSFYSAPIPSQKVAVEFIAYGDMGKAEQDGSLEHWEENPSLNTTRNVLAQIDEIDLVLHIGDISYAVGYSAQWDEFMDQIQPVATRVPYMTCDGNHERDFPNSGSYYNGTDSGGECGVPYRNRFLMPTSAPDNTWYSIDYGCVHFIFMSTEHYYHKGSPQYEFLENDLANVDRTVTPWVVLSGHRPMYIDSMNNSTFTGDLTVARELRQVLEDLMVQYGVDVAFWGHHHSYQRTCHVYRQQCYLSGFPVHLVIGMAGMSLSLNTAPTPPDWLMFLDVEEYGYSRVSANATHFHFKYFGNTSGLKDQLILTK